MSVSIRLIDSTFAKKNQLKNLYIDTFPMDERIPIEIMANQLKLLGDKTRLSILNILLYQEASVCHLVEVLNMTQPNISQHLKKLKKGAIVKEERRGQWIFYSLNIDDKPHLQKILARLPELNVTVEASLID